MSDESAPEVGRLPPEPVQLYAYRRHIIHNLSRYLDIALDAQSPIVVLNSQGKPAEVIVPMNDNKVNVVALNGEGNGTDLLKTHEVDDTDA